MGNARSFAQRIERWGEVHLRKQVTMLVNGVTLRLYVEITSAPEHKVDTGRARAGWAIALAAPGDYVPPARRRPGRGKRATGPLFEMPSAEKFIARLTAAPLHAKRVIYNNVEYIVWIELGTERQPGMHVVRAAIQRVMAG